MTFLSKFALKDDFGIDFKNTALLDEAFTHASYVNEHPREKLKYYERIEFLGDAVMQLCVSEYLFKRYPTLPEGKLSRLRAAMVCEDSFICVSPIIKMILLTLLMHYPL